MRALTHKVKKDHSESSAFDNRGPSVQLTRDALCLHSKATRLLGSAALTLAIAGCGYASLGPASMTSAATARTMAQSLNGSLGDRVLSAPAVMGGHLILPLRHSSGHGYLPSKKLNKNLIYVADPDTGQVLLYNSQKRMPPLIGEIVDGLNCPVGAAVDSTGTLYVTDDCNNDYLGSIDIYPAGQKSPSLVITNGVNSPWGIAVDSNGNVFIANLNNGSIAAYAAGQTSPYETIPNSDFKVPYSQPVGLAIDGSNNVWVTSDTNATVYEIPAGSSGPVNADLADLAGPAGIAFDASGDLYVSNNAANDVTFYPAGSQEPSETITSGVHSPQLSAVTPSGKFFQSNQESDGVQGYPPGQGSPSTFIELDDPLGIAVSPAIDAKRR